MTRGLNGSVSSKMGTADYLSLRMDRRGGMMIFMAFLFPAMIAVGLLAVDGVRAYSQAAMVNYATQAAALAAGSRLGNYYSQGATAGTASITAAATTISNANIGNLPNVTSTTTVTLGTWDSVASSFTSLGASGASPNAVQVIGQATIATLLGGTVGTPSLTVTKTAVATLGTAKTFNVVVLNDMGQALKSPSYAGPVFSNNDPYLFWQAQRVADQTILNCIANSGSSASQFGVTGFVEKAYILQALTTVNKTNAATMSTQLLDLRNPSYQYCWQSKGAPACHGSNVAAGIYSAIQQFSNASNLGASNHIVIITNELPVYDPTAAPVTYTLAMGTGVSVSGGKGTGSSATALCGASPVCNNAYLLEMAEGQAAAAGAGVAVTGGTLSFTVSTIYYSGDARTPAGSAGAYATEIGSWVKNGGLALTTASKASYTFPTATYIIPDLATQAAKVCQMIGSSLQVASN